MAEKEKDERGWQTRQRYEKEAVREGNKKGGAHSSLPPCLRLSVPGTLRRQRESERPKGRVLESVSN